MGKNLSIRMAFKALPALAACLCLHAGDAAAQGTGSWGTKPNLPAPRANGAVGLIGRNIYYAGGYYQGKPVNTLYIYNLDAKVWKTGANMPASLHHIGQAAVLDGKLYSIGGDSHGDANSPKPGGAEHTGTSYNFAYDPATDKWKTLKPLIRTTATSAIIAFGKKIYVIGGVDSMGIVHTATQEYDPATDTWTLKKPMFTPRDHAGVEVLDSLIYVCSGGVLKKNTGAFEAYSPASDTWYKLPNIPTPRSDMGFGLVKGRMYAFGGEWPGIYDNNEEYDPVAKSWRAVIRMPEAWKALATAIVGDSIYSFGGYTASGMTSKGIVFIPPNNPSDVIATGSMIRSMGRAGSLGPTFSNGAIDFGLGLDASGRLRAVPVSALPSGVR
ncbi:MAG: Kelch repeat-containing protein [Fibrobacteres bacterium]|nr:Kelch repeat-containing protein [Fibrobacterota bacterium]